LSPFPYLSYLYTMHEQHEKLEEILASLEQPDDKLLQQQISEWVAASEENRKYYEEVKRIWFTGNEPGDMEYDIESEKKRFWDRVDGEAPVTPVRRMNWFPKIAVAAMLLIAAGIVVWKFVLTNRNTYKIIQTARLERDSVELADGSKVYLHGSSSVRYTTSMNGARREVWLEKGEAFFEITKDPAHPFIVHIDSAEVEVLGTSFDVRRTDSILSVAVATGKVQFTAVKNQAQALLTPGLTGAFVKAGTTITVTKNSNQLAWRTGQVKFYDTPLQEVLATMEHVYEMNVNMAPSLTKTRVTATINNLSFEKIVTLLEASLDIKVTEIDSMTYKARPVR
jgi:transmembrane sensor